MNARHIYKFSYRYPIFAIWMLIVSLAVALFLLVLTNYSIAQATNNDSIGKMIVYYDYYGEPSHQVQQDGFISHGGIYSEHQCFFWTYGEDISTNFVWENSDPPELADSLNSISLKPVSCYQYNTEDSSGISFYIEQLNYYGSITIKPVSSSALWYLNDELISTDYNNPTLIDNNVDSIFNYTDKDPQGFKVSGKIFEDGNLANPVVGAVVQYCQWNPLFSEYVPVLGISSFSDLFGNYSIYGIGRNSFPGIICVYKCGYEIAYSEPIWYVPESIDLILRFVNMVQVQPPVPPTPPDPPVPPVPPTPPVPPVPPEPVPPQPVPPTPVPTPVDPGGDIAQTGDSTAIALAIAGMLALCGACAFGASAKPRRRSK